MEIPAPVILASASPRRQTLLRELVAEFSVHPADVDESFLPHETPWAAAVRLARLKAQKVAATFPDSIVIAGDTIVSIGEQLLAKPASDEEAASMLQALSGRTHEVITALSLQWGGLMSEGSARTQVTFRELSLSEVRDYVATGEPSDKAGAYAIQGGAASFVVNVKGPIDAVIGFPQALCRQLLEELSEKKNAGYKL